MRYKICFFHFFHFFISFVIVFLGSQVFGQQLSFELPESIVYQCPTPVEIRIDSQGQEIIGAAVSVSLSDFAEIQGFIADPVYKMVLGHTVSGDKHQLSGAVFVYPGTVKGQQRYGTLWIQQNNTIPNVEISFLRNVAGDQGDGVDIFAYGGKDILQRANNTILIFTEGECLYELPTSFVRSGQSLDDFNTTLQQVSHSQKQKFWSERMIIIMSIALFFLFLLLFLYKRKKTEKDERYKRDERDNEG